MPRLNYGFKGPALTPQQAASINAPTSTQEYVYSAQLGSVAVLAVPATPSIGSASGGNASVALSWTAPSSASPILSYEVEYSFDGGTEWNPASSAAGTSTTVADLVNGQTYYFRIAATNIIGQSAWSAPIGPITPSSLAPVTVTFDVPKGPQVYNVYYPEWVPVGTVTAGQSLTITADGYFNSGSNTWYPAGSGSGYFGQYDNSLGFLGTIFKIGNGTAFGYPNAPGPPGWTLTVPESGTLYVRYNATELNGYTGPGHTLTIAGITPLAIAPAAPTGVTATAGNAQVTLGWLAPVFNGGPSPSDYVVQYSTDGTSWTTFSDSVSTTQSVVVTSLTNGQQYSFRVAAVNSIGTGDYSSTATATPVNAATLTITQQPKNDFSVTGTDTATFSVAASITTGSISYQWQAYAYDQNYNLNWQNIPNATSSTFTITPQSWYTVTGMSIDYINDVRLRCVVTGTNSAGTQNTTEARWVILSNITRYADFSGDNGTYPNGSSTVGGQTYNTISLQSGEGMNVFADDYYSALDTTWYSSNAYTVAVQSSPDATTWTNVATPVNLRSAYSVSQPIAAQSGTVYYRVMLTVNWPFTTTNGSQSSARSAPTIFLAGAIATWS